MIAIVFCVFAALAAWDSALSSGSLSGYLNTTEIDSFVSSLGSSISSSTLGTSINNHKITAYLLSENGKIYLGLTSKPTILISAGHTTTQPLSVTMALYILGSFVSSTTADSNYSLFKFLMQSTNIYIVPIINIDAYTNISDSNTLEVFLKNFHDECGSNPGVDLNRNFNYKFGLDGSTDACADSYQGTSAASELETSILAKFASDNSVKMWLHYDGTGDVYYLPWSYDGTNDDYGSSLLNSTYSEIKTGLEDNGATYGTQESINGANIGGSIIDFGLSLGAVSVQAALNDSIITAASILDTCALHLTTALSLLSPLSQPLLLNFTNLNIEMCTGDTCEDLARISLTYSISNPSLVKRSISINLNLTSSNDISFNITTLTLNSKDYTWTEDLAFDLSGNQESSIIIIVKVIGNVTSFDVNTVAYAYLYESLVYPDLAFINSGEATYTTSTEDNSGLFLRTWYVSGSHHEGVAIGLVSAVFFVFLALVILLIFCLYKNDPGDLENFDSQSEYGIKEEVHVVKRPEINLAANIEKKEEAKEARPPSRTDMNIQKAFGKPSFESNVKGPEIEKNKFAIAEKDQKNPIVSIPNKSFVAPPKNIEIPRDKFEGKSQDSYAPVVVASKSEVAKTSELKLPPMKYNEDQGVEFKSPSSKYEAKPNIEFKAPGAKYEENKNIGFQAPPMKFEEKPNTGFNAPPLKFEEKPNTGSIAPPFKFEEKPNTGFNAPPMKFEEKPNTGFNAPPMKFEEKPNTGFNAPPMKFEEKPNTGFNAPPMKYEEKPVYLNKPEEITGPKPIVSQFELHKPKPFHKIEEGSDILLAPQIAKITVPTSNPGQMVIIDSSESSSEIDIEILQNEPEKKNAQLYLPSRHVDNDEEFEIKHVTDVKKPFVPGGFQMASPSQFPPVREPNPNAGFHVKSPSGGFQAIPVLAQKKNEAYSPNAPFILGNQDDFERSSSDSSGSSNS